VLSFAGLAMVHRGLAAAALIPLYAGAIIALRTLGGGLPDRLGPRHALTIAAAVAAAAASGTFFAFFDVRVGLGRSGARRGGRGLGRERRGRRGRDGLGRLMRGADPATGTRLEPRLSQCCAAYAAP
jgi:hypothetical protein